MKKLKFLLLVITFLVFHSQFSFCQNVFQKAIGGSQQDEAFAIINALDKGYIICGYTSSYGAGGKDILITKIDSSGNIIWAKAYGGTYDDVGYKIIATKYNSYLITAWTLSFGQGEWDVLLIKIDNNGNLIWSKAYGTPYEEVLEETIESDNGFLLCGYTSFFKNPYYDAMIISLDKAGNIIWAKTYSESSAVENGFFSMIKSNDSNYIAIGHISSVEVKCLKIDLTGNIIWDKLYSGGNIDAGRCIIYSNDGGYLVSGESNSFTSSGDYDCLLMKIDETGSLKWAHTYGGSGDDFALAVKNVFNSGYIATGFTESFGFTHRKVYALRIDNTGNLLWSKAYGDSGWDGISQSYTWGNLRNVLSMSDKGFLMADYTESFGSGNGDAYLIKTDSLGNSTECATYSPATQSQSVNLSETNGNPVIKVVPLVTTVPDLTVTDINPNDITVCGCNFSVNLSKDTATCQGNLITLKPVITPDTIRTAHYLWNDNSTNKTLTVKQTGTYSVTVTDNVCSSSASVNVNITIPVAINPAFHNQSQCLDSSIAFTINPTAGTAPISYQWLLDGNTIPGATNSLYSKASIGIADSGKYSCIVSNNCNSVTSDIVSLTPILCNRIHHTISGYVTYDNKAKTPMSSKTALTETKVYLYNSGGTIIDTSQTDDRGYYEFVNIINGNYWVSGNSNKAWGGGNPIDALIINRCYVHLTTIADTLWRAAGDVNANGQLDPIDALLVNRRYISLITQFPNPDWLFEKIPVIMDGVDIRQDIQAECYGDVNGTYTPPF